MRGEKRGIKGERGKGKLRGEKRGIRGERGKGKWRGESEGMKGVVRGKQSDEGERKTRKERNKKDKG